MGTDELRNRENWQDASGKKAGSAEGSFLGAMTAAFSGTDFRVRSKPREFNNIYSAIELSPEVLAEIYDPKRQYKHGVVPDYAIDNIHTKKTLYVEVKRQDGWVEGKQASAGRGNAHERSCKFFTPGLLKILRQHGKLSPDALPFWTVFQGDISRDPKRVREVTCWFGEHSAHFFMWRNPADAAPLVSHFENRLRHLLL